MADRNEIKTPSPVVRAFGGATVANECPTCLRLYRVPPAEACYLASEMPIAWSVRQAQECCGPWRCEKHDVDLKRGHGCDQCQTDNREAKLQAQYAAAVKVPVASYEDKYLFREGFGRDGFFQVDDVDDMRKSGHCPDWAFACEPRRVSEGDCDLTDHVAEGILSDFHEDASEWVDQDKVDQASKLLLEACAEVCSYEPDEGTVVLLEIANGSPQQKEPTNGTVD